MGFLLYPLTEGALEVWADLFQLSGEDVSTLVQIELGCIAAEEKVERQRLVLITNGACVEDYFLKIKIVSKMHRKATIPKKAHAKISVLSFHVPE